LDAYRAEATPEDKLAYVENLQKQGRKVMMIGDGINDAPVLAQADVSAAVATSADVARDGAGEGDIVEQCEARGHRPAELGGAGAAVGVARTRVLH